MLPPWALKEFLWAQWAMVVQLRCLASVLTETVAVTTSMLARGNTALLVYTVIIATGPSRYGQFSDSFLSEEGHVKSQARTVLYQSNTTGVHHRCFHVHASPWSVGRRLTTSAFSFSLAWVTEECAHVRRQVCTVQLHCSTAEALHRRKLALQVRHDSQSPALSLLVFCFRTLTLDDSVFQPVDETREQGDCPASDTFSCMRFRRQLEVASRSHARNSHV